MVSLCIRDWPHGSEKTKRKEASRSMDAGTVSAMKMAEVQNSWSIGLAKNVQEVMKEQASALLEMMEQSTAMMEKSVNPHIGGNIDVRV